jgi:hypothetical protein
MDGGRHVGLFDAIGRETKGAFRSLSYDLRQSRRFRRIGVIAAVTVAGGVIATGALLREPVPGLAGLDGDGEDAGIVDGWFGFGSDTAEQDAEASESASASEALAGEAAEPSASPTAEETRARGGGGTGSAPGGSPGLVPVGEETPVPGGEEGGSATPDPGEEPGEEPTSEPPTQEPSEEPTSEPPATEDPGPSPSPTGDEQLAKSGSNAPAPRKGPVGG